MRAKQLKVAAPDDEANTPVVALHPSIALALIRSRVEEGYRIEIGGRTQTYRADASVDRQLLDEAIETRARVVVDPGTKTIFGALLTSRPLVVDREGDVNASVRSFTIDAEDSMLLRTPTAFLQLDRERAELYAKEAVVRARGAIRALAQLIKLN